MKRISILAALGILLLLAIALALLGSLLPGIRDLTSILLVFAFIALVMWLVLGGMRRNGYSAKTFRGIGAYRDAADGTWWLSGAMSSVAIVSVIELFHDAGFTIPVVVAAIMAAVTWVMRFGAFTRTIRLGSDVIGCLGTLAAIGDVFTKQLDGCVDAPAWQTLLIAAGILVVGYGASLLIPRWLSSLAERRRAARPSLGLAVCAGTELAIFLASPLGMPVLSIGADQLIVAIAVGLVLGCIAGVAPNIVLGLGTLAVTLGTIGTTIMIGDVCSATASWSFFTAVAAYAVMMLVSGLFVRRP